MASKVEAFKSLISFASGSHLGLKGGTKTQRELISATGEELRMFLQGYKGKHISAKEIEAFYKERFPQLDLKIKSEHASDFWDRLFGGAVATAGRDIAEDLSGYRSFDISIYSKSFMDKLKSLFHIKNDKKDFYVTTEFVNNIIHEGTHTLQEYMKPAELAFKRSIKGKSAEELEYLRAISEYRAAENIVYNFQTPLFSPGLWGKKLMRQLKKCEYSQNPETMPDVLKFCIRTAQEEKEAHATGYRECIKFMFPNIAKTEIGNKILDLYPRITASNPLYRFNDKIKVMKKEYFKIIAEERKKHAASLNT